MSSELLVGLMEQYRENYYESEKRNFFFKKSQKIDCAKKMTNAFPIEDMINTTVYIIPDTNKIIFNYTIFKLYANDDIYNLIIQKVLDLYDIILTKNPDFEIHVILDTFTITAAERYKNVIKMFCEKCMNSKMNYTDCLRCMYIYYCPSMIESIAILLKPFIDPKIISRVTYYSKVESPSLLQEIHNQK